MTLTWPAPAKINLFLYITGRRNDGYHELQTLFQFLNYGDTISIKLRKDNQIRLLTNCVNLSSASVDNDDNIIVKAGRLLQQYCIKILRNKHNNYLGADIYLRKILPIGGGLGGGSSNAATTLIALNHYWKTNIDDITLTQIAKQLGADVPIFVRGYSAFAEGIGDKFITVEPVEKWYLVIYPGISIQTKNIFADPQLKRNSTKCALSFLLRGPYKNDCESLVKQRFPKVAEFIFWMLEYTTSSRITGTGSCIFAEFPTEVAARQVLDKLPKFVHGFVAQGINKSPLHTFRAWISRLS